MTRPTALVVSAVFSTFAIAQPPAPSTISAEAIEYVRAKPDYAKIYVKVETRNQDAKTSATEHEEAVKKATEVFNKLNLKNMKLVTLNPQSARTESDVRPVFAPGEPRVPRTLTQYLNSRTLLITISDANPDQLELAVQKVQQEALQHGLGGDMSLRSTASLSTGIERGSAPQVTFGKRDGWDDLTAPAVAKATKRAMRKAELLAQSAGLKPGDVIAVSDDAITVPAPSSRLVRLDDQSEADEQTTYVDGELVRKVRVRVVISASK